MTAPGTTPVHRLAHAALHCLRHDGATRTTVALPSCDAVEIAYRGPGAPEAIPDTLADYDMVLKQGAAWSGAHRLVVRAPLIVLDLAWNRGEPARIMTFCRGDWEDEFLETMA